MTRKQYLEKTGADPERLIDMVIGEGGGILPQKISFQGYLAHVKDEGILFVNDKLGVETEIPYSAFTQAEFGVGSAQLWLQCVVQGRPFVFCMPRRQWKSPAAKLLMEKIGERVELLGMKEYRGYTGKLFLFYLFK